jgi:hypothetical protein
MELFCTLWPYHIKQITFQINFLMYFEGYPHYNDFIFKPFLGLFGFSIILHTSQNMVHSILGFGLKIKIFKNLMLSNVI